MKNVIIFGAGPSGAVLARRFAEQNYKVTVFEKRNHIAGNLYDYKNKDGIIIHKYGPHIFQCSDEKIINYVKKYSDWKEFRHKVNVKVKGKEVPLPINFESIDILFPSKSEMLKQILKKEFKDKKVIYIMDLLKSVDELKKLGEFIYENIFENYTIKMWGLNPKDIDPTVLKRVPLRLSYDDGYFSDDFQAVPIDGYTKLINNILNHKNIKIKLNSNPNILEIKENKTYINGKESEDTIIWTGPIDKLFNFSEGELPYRSLKFKLENYKKNSYQSRAVVNYPSHPTMTRITLFNTFIPVSIVKR